MTLKKYWVVGLKLAVSVALLTYLTTLVDLVEVLSALSRANPYLLGAAYIALLVQVAISAFKWKVILRSDSVDVRYSHLLVTYFIGNFFSLFLPSSVGGDIYRSLVVRKTASSLAKSVSSVLFDRLTGVFALVSIGYAAYLWEFGGQYTTLLGLVYVAGIMGFLVIASDSVLSYVSRFPSRVMSVLSSTLRSFNTYRNSTVVLGAALALAFLFQLNIVLINKLYCTALGIDVAFTSLLVIIPLVYLVEMIPISINGLGIRESAFAYFFVAIGHTVEEGLAVAVLVLVMRYLVGAVGGICFIVVREQKVA